MLGGVVDLVEVDPEHDRDVGVGGRGGDHDLLGPTREVDGGLLAGGEQAGRLDHDVDSELLPRQRGGVALGEHPELLPVDLQRAVERAHRARVGTEDRVVLEQMRKRLRIGQVVDGDPLDVGRLGTRLGGAEHVAADPAESIDCDAYGHPCCAS